MGKRLRDVLLQELGELRYEPVDKRIRGMLADRTVVDTERAVLVWEPKRVMPNYAVPAEDIDAELVPDTESPALEDPSTGRTPRLEDLPAYGRNIPFAVHTADGDPLDVRALAGERPGAAFRLSDPALAGYVIVSFDALDAWYEEDELNLAHPRDPFHRIEIVHSSRHVRVERDGQLLAESTRPYLLYESLLPLRYYLPPEDVATELLRSSPTITFCAYKGRAAYWATSSGEDIAWSYADPLREATEVRDRIAFFNDRVDLRVNGRAVARPSGH